MDTRLRPGPLLPLRGTDERTCPGRDDGELASRSSGRSIGAKALENMFLAAGFTSVERTDNFTLVTEFGRTEFSEPHVVMTGIV